MSFVELVSFKMEWPKYMLLFVVFLANVYGIAFDVKGVIAAVVTPFQENNDVNLDYIPEYAIDLINMGADGVLVGAIPPEVPVLTLDERKNLLDAWVKARPFDLSIVHEVGGLPMADVLELAKYSESLGVDALMIIPNKDNMPTDVNSLVKYVSEVAQAAPNLQILYHHPRWLTNLNIVDIVRQLKDQNIKLLGVLGSLENAKDVADLLDRDHIFIDHYKEKAGACKSGFFSNMGEATDLFANQMKNMNNNADNNYTTSWLQEQMNRIVTSFFGEDEVEWTGQSRYYFDRNLTLGNARNYIPDINLPTKKPQTSTVTTTTTEKNNLTTEKPQTTTVTTTTTTEKKKLLVDKLMKVDLKGKRLTPVFTPFKQNGDVNLGIIPAYANYLYKQNITTIWIFSTAGESFSVNLCERKSIINVWVNINKKRNYGFVIFVGTGFLTATESCNFASYCQSLNVTAIVYKTMTDGSPVNSLQAMREINSIAQCAPSTPIFYYNDENYILCGGTRNVSVSLVVKVAAAQIPSFGGLISTLEDAILSHEYNPTIQHIGFYFYQIPDSTFSILQLDALATPFANLFPKAILAIDNAQSADEAIIQHDQFSKLAAPLCQLRPECRLFCALNILKLSMKKITGINTGSPRRPLCQIARRDDIDTEKILKSLGYL